MAKKPELFKPTLEKEKEVAEKLSKLFSSKVGVRLSDGTVVPGERDKLKVSINDSMVCSCGKPYEERDLEHAICHKCWKEIKE